MQDLILYDYPGSICSQMARLAMVEKGLEFKRQTVDIIKTSEQFEPWYIALNPAAVVPTLKVGDEIVTDTIRIVNRINEFDGPDLTLGEPARVQDWLSRIMGLHYGVLLYSGKLDADRTSPTMISRAKNLQEMAQSRPELAGVMAKRIAGNTRMQATLKDPELVAEHFASAKGLVADMNTALGNHGFLSGDAYSLADSFATAALARFRMHGFEHWWSDGKKPNVGPYYARMKRRSSFGTAAVED